MGCYCASVGVVIARDRSRLESNGSGFRQLLPISLILLCFWLVNLYFSLANGVDIHKKVALGGLVTFVATAIVCAMKVGVKGKDEERGRSSATLYVILLIYFAVNLFLIKDFLYKGDSYTYYKYVRDTAGLWNFSPDSLHLFQDGWHRSYGWSLVAYPLYLLLPKNGIGLRVANLSLVVLSALALDAIIQKRLRSFDEHARLLVVLVYLLSPIVLGGLQEVSLELPMTCFFIIFVACWALDLNILAIFFAILTTFTKENGILLIAGFTAAEFVVGFLETKHTASARRCCSVRPSTVACLTIVPLMLACAMESQSTDTGWGASSTMGFGQVGAVNSIQLNGYYMLMKLREMTLMNFQWLPLALAAMAGVFALVKGRHSPPQRLDAGLLLAFIAMTAFQLLYFTYPNYRYLFYSSPFVTLAWAYAANYVVGRAGHVRGFLCALSLVPTLFLVQSFVQVDPIENAMFRRVDSGNGQIVSLAEFVPEGDSVTLLRPAKDGELDKNSRMRDYIQTNRSYLGLDVCMREIFSEIDVDESEVVLEEGFHDAYWGNQRWTFNNIFGTTDIEAIRWDDSARRFTYTGDGAPIQWVSAEDFRLGKSDDNDYIWYIDFPFCENKRSKNLLNELTERYGVTGSHEVECGCWKVNAYCFDIRG